MTIGRHEVLVFARFAQHDPIRFNKASPALERIHYFLGCRLLFKWVTIQYSNLFVVKKVWFLWVFPFLLGNNNLEIIGNNVNLECLHEEYKSDTPNQTGVNKMVVPLECLVLTEALLLSVECRPQLSIQSQKPDHGYHQFKHGAVGYHEANLHQNVVASTLKLMV